ncbi:23S rRNA pseudouridine(955/2504/2580) synthase RluC [Marinimicrobium sp. C6131]|uniref:23S rRNA pseudouridine(955/2504/2580) synthase RluC n=1 Tax=Marinimicrobium sp. C6131 TaxID=3022676 RepID=UPI00223CB9A8|nr:23S rRNA pseudouridine(955/2504/2580) synthase RluC [Marinimicrobium sp. C6131]UZJ45508.1 23S rRNA pseudouridine(955/2504/2580) synthase RluC [Marinimicrobium sp. C6131]
MTKPSASRSAPPPQVPPTQVQWLTVDADQAGQRIDNFLMARLKGVPKSRVYNILRKGEVRVNKGRVKPDYRLVAGDRVRVPPVRVTQSVPAPKPSDQLVRQLEAAILFENEGLLVLNKPPGLAVHGGSGVSLGLIEVLRQMRPEARFLELIHRLDRDTSGCIMVAKKRSMLRHMQAALRDKSAGGVTKIYQALVLGRWSERKTKVDAPLMRLEINGDRIVKVHPEGKPSLTRFRVLRRFEGATLVEAHLITGRTHQIRVHAQSAGHSLVGDEKYGDDEANKHWRARGVKRLFLHAAELGFYLPGQSEMTRVSAPLPDDLDAALAQTPCLPE